MKLIRNNKKNILIFTIIFTITLIIFIPFLHKHYSTDTYMIANIGYKEYAINYSLNDGRVLMGLIGFAANVLNIQIDVCVLILTILALFISCISVICLNNYILKIKSTEKILPKILVIMASYFTIFNFMFIENMIFVECFVMALSILLYLIAAEIFVDKGKNYIIKTIILVLLGLLCYQGTISMYLICILVFSLLKNIDYKKAIKNLIYASIILLVDILIQMLIIKLNGSIFHTQQTRVANIEILIDNIKFILHNFGTVIVETANVFPRLLYFIFLLMLFLLIILKEYKEKTDGTVFVNSEIIIAFCIIFGMAISLLNIDGFFGARTRFAIGASIGIWILYLYCVTDIAEKIKNKYNFLIITTFIIYSLTIVVNYVMIMNNTLRVNEEDKKVAIEVLEYIDKYEKENNIQVNKIVTFYGIFEDKAYYNHLGYISSTLSWSAIRTEWSIEGTLEMYTDKDFEKVKPTRQMLIYYINNVDKQKDYLCINDTLYMPYYLK